MRKIFRLCSISVLSFASVLGLFGCSNAQADAANKSNGAYRIVAPGHEGSRFETISISDCNNDFYAYVSGTIYDRVNDKTVKLTSRSYVHLTEVRENLRSFAITSTKGDSYLIYCVRKGVKTTNYASYGLSIAGYGGNVTVPIASEYAEVSFLWYQGYQYKIY